LILSGRAMQHSLPQQTMLRRLADFTLATTCLLGLLYSSRALADINVEVSGVEPDIEQNVQIFLSLNRYRERDDLDAALLERLQERAAREVAAAMKPFGYYEPQVRTQITRTSDTDWSARIEITPGTPVVLSEVDVAVTGPGETEPDFGRIRESLPMRAGGRLDHGAYDAVKTSLQRTAATLGYLDARLTRNTLLVDPPNHSATATLSLETGKRYRFGTTTVDQTAINPELLQRFLRYQDGEPFDSAKLLRSQFALDDSQYFSTVEVLPGTPDRETLSVPIAIRADPVARDRYQFGFGYGTDTEARGTASWENRRLNTRGHRFRTELKAAAIAQSLEALYVVPIGDPALEKLSFALSAINEDRADLDTRSFEFEPSVTQVLGGWQRVLFGRFVRTTTERPALTLTPGAAPISITDTLLIPGISYASLPKGYLGEALFSRALYAELRGSAGFLGSDSEFIQLRIQAERVFDLTPSWHLLLRAEFGASAVREFSVLPGSERFFAGGDRSVRGFGFNELSPLDEGGSKVGGRHLMTGTAEVIRDLPRNFGIAFFVDAGNAFNKFGDPLQYSAGIGFRWRLPVVTIGVDIAQPLTNPRCRAALRDARCVSEPGFDKIDGPRLHLNFSPKL